MQTPVDAPSVMLHTLLGIEEVLANLESEKASGTSSGDLLEANIGILKNIWEVVDDYKAKLPNSTIWTGPSSNHVER